MGNVCHAIFNHFQTLEGDRTLQSADRILAVGMPKSYDYLRHHMPQDSEVSCVGFGALSPEFLEDLQVDCILCPLFTHDFDCIELTERLHRHGFEGGVRAVTAYVPRADIVRKDVVRTYPGVNFDILQLP